MERYLWDIGEDRQELLYSAEFAFPSHFEVKDSRENIRDSIPLEKSALQNLKKEDSPLNLRTADFLLSATHRSEPRFLNTDVDDIVSDTWDYSQTKAELVKEGSIGFQEVLFQSFKVEEVMDIFEISRPQAKKIRNGKAKRLDLEGVEEAFQTTVERLSSEPELSGDILFAPGYFAGADDPVIFEDAGPEEVRKAREIISRLEEFREDDPHSTGFLKAYREEGFESIYENLEKGNKWLYSGSRTEGRFLSALKQLGLAEKFGGKASPWELEEEIGWYRLVERELESLKQVETGEEQTYTDEELIEIISTVLGDEIDSISELDEKASLPSSTTYKERFGSPYNVYWRIGEDRGQERFDREVMAEMIKQYSYEKGKVPSMNEITDGSLFTDNTVYYHFDSYDELLKEAGLYTEKQVQEKDMDPERYRSNGIFDLSKLETALAPSKRFS